MERPWLLLCRVLRVNAPAAAAAAAADLHADAEDAEEHGLDVDAEADAEEHGLDVDAEAEAEEHGLDFDDAADAEEHGLDVDAEVDAEEHGLDVDVEVDAEEHGLDVDAEVGAEEHGLDVDVEVGAKEHGLDVNAEADAEEHGLDVDDAADAEEHGLDVDGENAGIGDAEDHHVEAADAQAQNAAVAEAEEGVQEHGAGGEAQGEAAEDAAAAAAQMLLEQSIIGVNTNIHESLLAHVLMRALGAGASDFTITAAPPPLVSSLVTGARVHPDPARPDMYPYIVATGRFCLLVHFAVAPSYGTDFDLQIPNLSRLVVVRHFLREDAGVQITACAHRLPGMPAGLSNIESVGLVCNQETGHIRIAELIVTTGAPQADVVYTGPDTGGGWQWNHYDNPLLTTVYRGRDWVPHGTVTINSTVLWYDLSWGIISCDLAQPPVHRVLSFHRLPPGRVLLAGAGVPDIHCRRCIAVSGNLVRYVEIILGPHDHEPARVNMWYRDVENNPWIWRTNYSVSFEDIWGHDSYGQTGLPPTTPMLVGVSPVDSNVIYFSLNQRLFGVDVPEHTVVGWEQYDLNRPGPEDAPVTSRYFISWNLDADGAINVGHQPDDPSDHGDSSPGGPADEGEIDYETPPE